MEFFIKGGLQQEDDIFAAKNLQDISKDEKELKKQMIEERKRAERRRMVAPWITVD